MSTENTKIITHEKNVLDEAKKEAVETKAIVSPIEFHDVRGNKLLYLKIQGNGKEVLINIGDKTFKAVKELCVPRETSTKVQILPPQDERTVKDVKTA